MTAPGLNRAIAALHDQFFCGCEWGYEAEHHPGDRQEWEKAARIAIEAFEGVSAYPHTVLVHKGPHGGFMWTCGCGASRGFDDERLCRNDGARHQRAHTEAYALTNNSGCLCIPGRGPTPTFRHVDCPVHHSGEEVDRG